ncbi:MAG: DUF3857 domain-containing transglutaminase family protein [Planctomycetota bacterium]|jgi:hypothetical protein
MRGFIVPLAVLLLFVAPLLLQAEDDPGIRALLAEAGGPDRHDDAAQVVVYDRTENRCEENGRSTKRHELLVKILSEEGAKNRSVATLGYDPKTKRAAFLRVRVFKASGGVVNVPLESLDIPNPGGIIFWGARRKLLPVPGLEPGDGLEIVTETVGFNIAYLGDDDRYIPPMVGHFYDVVPFWTGTPLLEKRYVLIAPRTKEVHFAVHNGALETSLTRQGDLTIYAFAARNLKPFHTEEHMVSRWDVAPKLVLATVPDWPTKSRWFWKVNEPQFAVDEAIRRKTAEIVAGKRDDEAKVKALVHWVADEVRYLGLSMGKGEGYTTHPSIMTFHERSGVCKDKAGLLVSMLRVAGFDAFLAMTQVGSRVEAVAADQFNHAVTALRMKDGRFLMLDPTWAPASREMWSSLEQEQNFVIGTEQGEPLDRTPRFPPESNRLTVISEAKVRLEGRRALLVGKLVLQGTGYAGTYFRRKLQRTPAGKEQGFFESLLEAVAAGAEVREVEFTKPLDFASPVRIVLRWRSTGAALVSKERVYVRSPVLRLLKVMPLVDRLLQAGRPDERKHPFNLRNTLLVQFRETLDGPAGFVFDKPCPESRVASVETEAVAAAKGERYFAFHLARQANGGAAVFEGELVVPHKVVPPEAYEEYRSAIRELKTAMNRWVGMERQ